MLRHKYLVGLLLYVTILNVFFIQNSNAVTSAKTMITSESKAIEARDYINKTIFGNSNRLLKTSIKEVPTYCKSNPKNRYCATWNKKYNVKVYEVIMEKGISSIVFEISPKSYKRIVLWARGHYILESESSPNFYKNVEKTLSSGSKVFLFSMPFMFPNSRFTNIEMGNFGVLQIGPSHNELAFLTNSITGSPLKYFFQPELAILDRLVEHDEVVAMAGLSGGGWTSTVFSAIEPRIQLTYAVAGSLPFSVRSEADADLGDWEQWLIGIFPKYGYLDMYVLGTYPERKVVNVYNTNDPCCFAARAGFTSWANDVEIKSGKLGGKFRVFIEDSTVHDFGPKAFDAFLRELGQLKKP
jgi:hypothetical protein